MATIKPPPNKVSRETFIADHALVCNALPAKKYDEKKATWATHSVEYSRRKCAKNLWRKLQKKNSEALNHSRTKSEVA